jgi:hypothetical protein
MVTPRKLHPKQRGRKCESKMPMFDDGELTDADIDALQRALHQTRADPGLTKKIEDMLKEHDRVEVAKVAANYQQVRHLRLQTWQLPPCKIGSDATIDPEIMKIGKRLVRLGLSLYEPDPIRALKAAEKKKARR